MVQCIHLVLVDMYKEGVIKSPHTLHKDMIRRVVQQNQDLTQGKIMNLKKLSQIHNSQKDIT